MELRQLRYFIAVAETGNFTRAAERLHVSQPPLSTQVKALERELGVTLLDRSNRGASLTAAGRAFLEEAREALGRLDGARRRARLAAKGEIGMLAVGFVSIADYGVLPPALKSFRGAFPLAEVQLHEMTTDAQVRELRAGSLDLGIALAPVAEPDLAFERLLREQLVLAVPVGHPLARGAGPVDLKHLAGESFIMTPRDIAPGLHDLVISRCRAAGFTPQVSQQARQMQTVISLVAGAMGVALVPASVRNLRRTGVRYRRLRGRAVVEVGILRRHGTPTALQQHFLDALRAAARQ
ncbi:MAG: LysR family transcriptional regulator [Pseudomonadota bacterium]|nr:MAG: LysR family transcriptional regulator [Pseudomonadota bacterium]